MCSKEAKLRLTSASESPRPHTQHMARSSSTSSASSSPVLALALHFFCPALPVSRISGRAATQFRCIVSHISVPTQTCASISPCLLLFRACRKLAFLPRLAWLLCRLPSGFGVNLRKVYNNITPTPRSQNVVLREHCTLELIRIVRLVSRANTQFCWSLYDENSRRNKVVFFFTISFG